jgi:hypothetical protein
MKKIHELETNLHVSNRNKAVGLTDSLKNEFFTKAQINFLSKHHYIVRHHPQKSKFEVFIEQDSLTPMDWTMIGLLFNKRMN